MKKLCAFLLTLVLLLGCSRFYPAQALAAGGETSVAFSADVNLSASANVKTGDYAHYFDYRTCIVHTSHGDYAVYYTDTHKTSNGSREMNRFSVIKIQDGSAQVVYQDWKPYDSSQISLHVDNDQNVWVLVAGDDGKLKDQFDGRGTSLNVAAHKIDAQTDDVTSFASVIKSKVPGGFGYAVSVMDPAAEKIYAVASGATSNEGETALYWVSFDMKTLTWDSTIHSIPQVGRHCYHYIYPDGQGGLIVVDERDSLVNSTLTPYPEIANNYGIITGENYIQDAVTGERFEGSRWDANYVWDQLDAYHIVDAANASVANSVTVAAADYSRVTGSQDERYTLQGRMRNEYPGTSNNSGDAFIDAQGNLHVLYSEAFSRAALDRVTTESTWYHKVYDANLNELTQGKGEMLVQEILGGSKNFVHSAEEKLPVPSTSVTKNSNSFRMYEDNEGNLYLIQGQTLGIDGVETFSVNVYQITGDPASGYTYAKVGSQVVPGGSSNSVISISNNRSNSAKDNKIGLLYKQGGAEDYHYMQLTITPGNPPAQPEKVVDKKSKSEGDAPQVTLPESVQAVASAVLTAQDQQAVLNGVEAHILLTVKNAEQTVTPEDKKAVKDAAGDRTIGQYLDLTLQKTLGKVTTDVPKTNAPLTVVLDVPEDLHGTEDRVFSVIRIHDGQAVVLEDQDQNTDTITILTDCFSVFAIAYQDPTPPSGGGGQGTVDPPSGGGEGSGGSPSGGEGSGGSPSGGEGNNNPSSGGQGNVRPPIGEEIPVGPGAQTGLPTLPGQQNLPQRQPGTAAVVIPGQASNPAASGELPEAPFVQGAFPVPETGDDTPLAAWTLLLAGGLAGLTALTLILRRKLKQ